MKNYDVKGGNNPADPLNTSNSMGGNNSWNLLGVFDDAIGSLLFGNPNASSEIMGELTGYNSQQREFAQQDYLLEKEQSFAKEQADPVYRMERMKAAGINPNTAASGISGGSPAASPSAPSVATNTQGAAQGLSAAAGAISQLGTLSAQNEQSRAAAKKDTAEASSIPIKTSTEQMRAVGELAEKFEHLGFPSVEAALSALAVDDDKRTSIKQILEGDGVIRMYDKEMTEINQKIKNAKEEYKLIRANIEVAYADADRITHDAALKSAQEAHEQVLKDLDNLEKEIRAGLRRDPRFDKWSSLMYAYEHGGVEGQLYQDVLRLFTDEMYSSYKGQFSAEVDQAYRKAYNETIGRHSGDVDYAEITQFYQLNEYWIKSTIDLMSQQNVMTPTQAAQWILQSLLHAGVGNNAIVRPDTQSRPSPIKSTE